MSLMNSWCGKISLCGCVTAMAISGLLLLAACGGDSNSSGPSNGVEPTEVAKSNSVEPTKETKSIDITVATFEELPVCTDKREGVTAYVKDEKTAYTCIDGDWTLADRFIIGESFDDLPVCTDKRKRATAFVKDEKMTYSCIDRNWTQVDGWSWDVPKELRFNSDISYGTMTDSRDKKVYKTIKIGDQNWMAENLNYADSTKTPSLLERNWCHDNKEENCNVAGRLYTWAAAVDSVKLPTDADNPQECGHGKTCRLPANFQGICPDGWHLPTNAEWDILFTEVGGRSTAGKVLKSQSGWSGGGNGTDDMGFSVFPAGDRHNNGKFDCDGKYTYFWSADEYDRYEAYFMNLDYDNDGAYLTSRDKGRGYSVRCLENNPKGDSGEQSCSAILEKANSWILDVPKKCRFNPEISYGTMTDSRDKKVYKTVKIGDQIWMAENLNYADSVKTPSLLNRSWCFDNDSKNCAVVGRFYTWSAVIDSVMLNDGGNGVDCGFGKTCTIPAKVQGICPDGWHLPTQTEWKILITKVGDDSTAGRILKSQTGWEHGSNGTDAFGFSALPAGYRIGKDLFNIGFDTKFWSASENDSSGAYSLYLVYESDGARLVGSYKADAFSVRCLKD